MGRNIRLLAPALLFTSVLLPMIAQAAPVTTVTTLTVSSTSIDSSTPLTLSATVTAGGAPVANGTVTFCDALAPFCEDSAIVGRAQLTAGSAQWKFIPGVGSHSYKAIFSATTAGAASTSSSQSVTVTGVYSTTTSLVATGNPSGYQLTATVVSSANHPPVLGGTVSFQDTTNNNFVLGTATLGTPTYTQSFGQASGSPVPTGNQPAAIGVGDFNGDGKPDAAIMDSYQNAITILLGNGNGSFAVGQFITGVGTIPCIYDDQPSNCSMAVGDFNHDGKLDLAETSAGDNEVFVLLGNGDGTFAPSPGSPVTVGNFPNAVRIGDFNRDGFLDLAVANSYDNTISIMLGNGDGTFTATAAPPLQVGDFPFFLSVADYNGDGIADVASANEADDTVNVYLSNGDGTFVQAPNSPFPSGNYNPGPLTAADFNNDGIPDIAVANYIPDSGAANSNVVIMLGNGDGSFTAATGSPVTVGLYPFALAAADFNKDGDTDLAVVNYGEIDNPSTQTLTLLLGDGKGGFTTSGPAMQLGDSPNDIGVADFNGDGIPDLGIPNIADFSTSVFLYTYTQTATASVSNITVAGTATHYVDAVYEGNTSFTTSTSATVPLLGNQIATTLTLKANPNPQMITMPVTFTATMVPAANQPEYTSPTGTVTFYDQTLSTTLGTAPMGANGQAVFTTSSIALGTHQIYATYAGDATYLPSNASSINVTIADLTIARVGNNNTTVLPGTTVTYTLKVTPQAVDTFIYDVSFSTTGLPVGATATFSPATLAAGSGVGTVTMTVETIKTAANTAPPSPFGRLPLALGLLLPLFGSRAARKRLRQLPPMVAMALFAGMSLAAVAGLSGCSGAGYFAEKKVPYSITVTATEGTVQRSTQVPLTIQ